MKTFLPSLTFKNIKYDIRDRSTIPRSLMRNRKRDLGVAIIGYWDPNFVQNECVLMKWFQKREKTFRVQKKRPHLWYTICDILFVICSLPDLARVFQISCNNFPVSLETGVLYLDVFQFVHTQYQPGDFAQILTAMTLSIYLLRIRNIQYLFLYQKTKWLLL
jgi:hypothetical protein